MKVSTILIAATLAMAPIYSTNAAPLYHADLWGGVGPVYTDNVTSLEARTSGGLAALLGSIPLVGPILLPLLPLLGVIGLSEVSAENIPQPTASQLTALAGIEDLLFNAANEVAGMPATVASPTNAPLQARGSSMGDFLTSIPFIGPFLQPLLPLLDLIGIASVTPEALSTMTLNAEQTSKLSQLGSIIAEKAPLLMPKGATIPQPVSTPSDVVPNVGADVPTTVSGIFGRRI